MRAAWLTSLRSFEREEAKKYAEESHRLLDERETP